MEIPKGYYLDSLSKAEIDGWLYRTKGSAQIQFWFKQPLDSLGKFISHRRYFKGKIDGHRFFAKQFLEPNLPNWTVKQSIEYQFQNLFLFRSISNVPSPLFLTDDIVGMEYIEGKTIKELVLHGKFDVKLAELIISQLEKIGPMIILKLESIGRRYDCSYNNILVKDSGRIVFVDFDYANKPKSIANVVQILKDLTVGRISFDRNGQLRNRNRRQDKCEKS